MLNLKKLTPSELDKVINSLEKIVGIIDDANIQLPLPLESPDGSVAEDVRPTADSVPTPELSLTSEARDRIAAQFRAAYGPGTLATPELNEALLDQVIRHAELQRSVDLLSSSIQEDGKKLLARYLGIPYVGE